MDRNHIQALIDNPPPKSPYFKLPSVRYLVRDEEESTPQSSSASRSKASNTVTSLWGKAVNMSEETKISFLADVLRFANIDFDAVAKDKGIASGGQIKQRLNTILLKEGFKLEGDRVIAVESTTDKK